MERAAHSQRWGENIPRKETPGARLWGYLGAWAQNHSRQRRETGACSDAVTRNIPAQRQLRSQAPRARRGWGGDQDQQEAPPSSAGKEGTLPCDQMVRKGGKTHMVTNYIYFLNVFTLGVENIIFMLMYSPPFKYILSSVTATMGW